MTVCYIPAEKTRFAVVVGQKTSRSAVVRTRVKRQIRGVLSNMIKTFTHPAEGVVMTRASIVSASSEDIRDELTKLMSAL